MKKVMFLIVFVATFIGVSCGNAGEEKKGALVKIETDFGDITLKLYDETPEHKKNFLKLVEEGFYDDLLFHRVMANFMIQGGDPKSKNAQAGARLGSGNPGYTLPAEIDSKYFHKKGALAAARKGGPSNPDKRSSGSQFYIVQGERFTEGKLDTMEMMMNGRVKNELMREKFTAANAQLNEFRKNNDQAGFNACVAEIREEVDSIFETKPQFHFSPEQKQAYSTIGGYPSLDGDYTVFGEVVEGMDVLDKIAAVETDQFDRPKVDVKMKIEVVK